MSSLLIKFRLCLLLVGLLCSVNSWAVNKNFQAFTNDDQQSQYEDLIEVLRCVVCQNQSLADSNAELAQDLRDEVRRMVINGQSDEEITGFLVQRYGDFVLYRPPVNKKTYVLWAGPAVLAILGILLMLFFILRHSKAKIQPTVLSEAEQAKVKQAIKDSEL